VPGLPKPGVRRTDGAAAEPEADGELSLGRQPGVSRQPAIEDQQPDAIGEFLVRGAAASPVAEKQLE
jgi:hypothetical protein